MRILNKSLKYSLKYRLILLYFLLVFIAMSVVGIFIVNEFKRYNIKNIVQDMDNIANNLVSNNIILKQEDYIKSKDLLQIDLQNIPISTGYEISIIDPDTYLIIASTNPRFQDKGSFEVLDSNTILATASSDKVEQDIKADSKDYTYYIKNIAYVQKNSLNQPKYIIYIRASLDNIDKMLQNVVFMLVKSTAMALVITFVLGHLISSTITKPINSLTSKALKMSKGDFSQRAKVYSSDEIGQLALAFNYLTTQIEDMIVKIDSEKNKLDAIIYHMKNGLVAMDQNGKIIHYNPTFKEMLDITEKDLIGKSYDKIIAPFVEKIGFKIISQLSDKTQSNSVTISHSGSYIKVTGAIFKNENQQLAGLIAVFQDITQTQTLEELRKEFVANVSHELKTPITSIKSYTETLLDGAVDDKDTAVKFLDIILSESDRMNHIIKDLLQLSHIDYKKESWDMKKSDIHHLIKKCITKMKLYAGQKNQTIIDKLPDQECIITMDSSKIEQTIINLISNAIKYSQNRGTITLSTKITEKYCEIYITDTGIGISKQDIRRIFDRFYRVDKGRSRSMGGTGLGLSIVKAIIDKHQGEIYVKSKINQGSTFLIRLPIDLKEIE